MFRKYFKIWIKASKNTIYYNQNDIDDINEIKWNDIKLETKYAGVAFEVLDYGFGVVCNQRSSARHLYIFYLYFFGKQK